ncbi:MAG: WHG domain-containing protein, partial [Candidatus Methanoperedens sp.]|nr:WHG domain-containing protein [Candidatus Methanoperedens sp.]
AKKIKEKEEWGAGLRSFESLKEIIKECMDAGYLAKTDLDVAAFAFWSFVHGIASQVIRDRVIMFSRERLNSIVESSFDFMLNSMSKERK